MTVCPELMPFAFIKEVSPAPRSCNDCVELQTIYAPLVQISGSSGTEINLNCRSAHSVEALQTPANQNVTFLEGALAIQNFCGVYRSYLFFLSDQQGEKIQAAFTFDEIFSNVTTPQSLAAPSYIPVNFPANYVAIEDLMSVGFQGGCLNTNEFQVFDQQFKITIGGTAYLPSTKINIRRGNEAGTLKVDRTITIP